MPPVAKPSECVSPRLPSLVVLRPEFDNLDLDQQAALLAGAIFANEYRRRTAEAILARCAKWVEDLK